MEMKWYVKRGFEDDLINALNNYGSACILGLAGMGKTTTARYIYTKLRREGVKVVYLTSDEESKTIKFKVTRDEEEEIRCISLKHVWSGKGDEAEVLAYAIAKAIEGTYLGKIGRLLEKFTGKKLEKLEHIENIKLKIKSSSDEAKEIVDKIYEWVESVFGKEFIDTLGSVGVKSKIEEFLKNNENSDLFYLLLELSMLMTVGVAGSSVIKSVRELMKREPKIKEDVVIIVDDLADFNEYELKEFVKFLRDKEIKILFVKRIDDSSDEGFKRYLKIVKFLSNKHKGLDLNDVLFKGANDFFDVDLRKRIFLIDSAEKEEFIKLLEANNYSAKIIGEKLNMEFDEALDLIYRASAGTICIALYMLEMGFSAEDMKRIAEAERYYSWSEIAKYEDEDEKRKMIESNKMLRFSGLYEIYEKLIEKNPCYIALIINDLAEDELKMFCEDERIKSRFSGKASPRKGEYYWMLEDYEEELIKDGNHTKRKVYRVKNHWKKFNVFIDALCDFHENGEEIEEDLKIIREVLLDILDKEYEELGEFTDRMILFSLDNIKWLFGKGIIKPKSAFIWCGSALAYLPRVVLEFLQIVMDMWEENKNEMTKDRETLLHTLRFARTLAEFGRNLFENENYHKEIFKKVIKFLDIKGDDVISLWKVWIYSSLAYGLKLNNFIEDGDWCIKQAENILKDINNSDLKILAEIKFLMTKARIEIYEIGTYNRRVVNIDTINMLNNVLSNLIDTLDNLTFKESMDEIFRPFGGHAEEIFRHLVNVWKGDIYYYLARANLYLNLEESEKFFRKCVKLSETLTNELIALNFIGKINVLKSYSFDFIIENKTCNFEKLWNLCKKYEVKINNETLARTCARYLIFTILTKNLTITIKKDLYDYLYLDNTAKTLFYGLSWILGYKLKDLKEIIEMLRDYDLSMFPSVNNINKNKIEVEEMYNSFLNGNKEDYNEYKKLAWNKIVEFTQSLVRIMFFYIINDLKTAKNLAEVVSSEYPKVPSELFKELSKAIEEEINAKSCSEKEIAKEKVKKAFVKLFYFAV
ncbi:hypothetical protein [Methanocaldococcus sp. FS406-22]|uniref:hypothetical protein n=1 Tax=Methanocaldococcus sp. (strain FS406-22) TaxID=644281 RepID=UPI00064E969C|nr:hypothetical protein [Methanocaldococcus sp. FS406-22]